MLLAYHCIGLMLPQMNILIVRDEMPATNVRPELSAPNYPATNCPITYSSTDIGSLCVRRRRDEFCRKWNQIRCTRLVWMSTEGPNINESCSQINYEGQINHKYQINSTDRFAEHRSLHLCAGYRRRTNDIRSDHPYDRLNIQTSIVIGHDHWRDWVSITHDNFPLNKYP